MVTIEEPGYLGSVTHVRARTSDGTMIKILLSNRRRTQDAFTWDEEVVASFDPQDVILLPEDKAGDGRAFARLFTLCAA